MDLKIDLDGEGRYEIETGVPFLDHMLSLMARHGLFDLTIKAVGDTEVDNHHTVEDVGLCLGEAVSKALGDKKGISRYGHILLPMDESLVMVVIDISNRPHLVFKNPFFPPQIIKDGVVFEPALPALGVGSGIIEGFNPELIKEFFSAFVNTCRVTLHINIFYGENTHHLIEAVFKAFGRVLSQAAGIDERIKGVPSTKGQL
ncbi:MAG: imidazoleglycerol-phosphate dehydratase [bacterium]|nr:imidazoleglycerol-phosphate dehydratase [bacterium]